MKKIYLLLIVFLICSCKEFIEPSIEGDRVDIIGPSDNMETNKYSVQFWWELLENASAYRLQVVLPSFGNTESLILDTLVKGSRFVHTFDPGSYEWRIRPENASSKGVYSIRKFTVHESSIENQQVQLYAPANRLLTRLQNIDLQWITLFGATNYLVQVDTNSFIDENKMVFNQEVSINSHRLRIEKDGSYQWRIKAINENQSSKWSVVNNFTVDRTPPAKVILISPANGANITLPVSLRWNTVKGASKYLLTVYKSDGTTPYNGSFPLQLSATSYSLNLGSYGEQLSWDVKAIDEAGNQGENSETRRFIIQ